MTGICFTFEEMQRELETARQLMGPFLHNSDYIFRQLKTTLEQFQTSGPSTLIWQVKENNEIRTIVSKGQCERGGGGRRVVGGLSFVWQIERVPSGKKSVPPKLFQLVGNASTVARVYSARSNGAVGTELAMWRMEIGDVQSPGCHFHTQVLGRKPRPPFPLSMPVPRFPSLMSTPLAALEFLLGELFQDDWPKHLGAENNHAMTWRKMQRMRLQQLFGEQQKELNKDIASPWVALKLWKPESGIFLAPASR